MRGRDKEAANERREELFAAAGWKCVICGKPLRTGVPQLAHRVIKSKHNLRIYGSKIINHPLNLVPVQTNDGCNSVVILNFLPAERLLSRIFDIVAGVEPEPNWTEHYEQLREEFAERRNR